MKLYIVRPDELDAPLVIDTTSEINNPGAEAKRIYGSDAGDTMMLGSILTVLVELTNVAHGVLHELERLNDREERQV